MVRQLVNFAKRLLRTLGWGPQIRAVRGDVILTVHGTGDGLRDRNSPKWWQADSAFLAILLEKIPAYTRAHVELQSFNWSGENSEKARLNAGRALAAALLKLTQTRHVHIIAHSHGGNVVREALAELSLWPEEFSRIRSVFSVGTPYFGYDPFARLKKFALYVVLSALSFTLLYFVVAGLLAAQSLISLVGLAATAPLVAFVFLVCFVEALWIPFAPKPTPPRRGVLPFPWLCVAGERDEAIGSLDLVGRSPGIITSLTKTRSNPWLVRLMAVLLWACTLPVLNFAIWYAFFIVTPNAMTDQGVSGMVRVSILVGLIADVLMLGVLRSRWAWLCDTAESALGLARVGAAGLAALAADQIISAQLARSLYGDDCHAGITEIGITPLVEGVGTLSMQPAIDASLEFQAIATYADAGARLRTVFDIQHSTLIDAFTYLSEQLEWSELVHTIYFKNDLFVEWFGDQWAQLAFPPEETARHGAASKAG